VHDARNRKEIELVECVQAHAAFVAVAIAALMKWIRVKSRIPPPQVSSEDWQDLEVKEILCPEACA